MLRWTAARSVGLLILAVWPLALGVVLDVLDGVLLSDAMQGRGWLEGTAYVTPIIAIAPVLFALLGDFVCRWRRQHTYIATGLAAAGVFGATTIAYVLTLPPHASVSLIVVVVAIAALVGGPITGLSYWLIRRPDRDAIEHTPLPSSRLSLRSAGMTDGENVRNTAP